MTGQQLRNLTLQALIEALPAAEAAHRELSRKRMLEGNPATDAAAKQADTDLHLLKMEIRRRENF